MSKLGNLMCFGNIISYLSFFFEVNTLGCFRNKSNVILQDCTSLITLKFVGRHLASSMQGKFCFRNNVSEGLPGG